MSEANYDFKFKVSSSLSVDRAMLVYRFMLHALTRGVPGDVAEFGTYKGDTAREMAVALKFLDQPRTVYIFDTCSGLPEPSTLDPQGREGKYSSAEDELRANLVDRDGAPLTNYELIKGRVEDTLPGFDKTLCFAHLDFDLYEPTKRGLEACFELIHPGGFIVIDDYGTEWTGVTRAVDDILRPHPEWCVYQAVVGQMVATRLLEDQMPGEEFPPPGT